MHKSQDSECFTRRSRMWVLERKAPTFGILHATRMTLGQKAMSMASEAMFDERFASINMNDCTASQARAAARFRIGVGFTLRFYSPVGMSY